MKAPITREGYERLQAKLDHLRRVKRPQIIQAIAEARAHGDLSENAEYAAAKEQQGLNEARIRALETRFTELQVIEPGTAPTDRVVFGVTVVLLDKATKRRQTYTLVGEDEADFESGCISVQSPVGRALIGHHRGDLVAVTTPRATVQYKIVEIRHASGGQARRA